MAEICWTATVWTSAACHINTESEWWVFVCSFSVNESSQHYRKQQMLELRILSAPQFVILWGSFFGHPSNEKRETRCSGLSTLMQQKTTSTLQNQELQPGQQNSDLLIHNCFKLKSPWNLHFMCVNINMPALKR